MEGRAPVYLMGGNVSDDKLALEVEFHKLMGEDASQKIVQQKGT